MTKENKAVIVGLFGSISLLIVWSVMYGGASLETIIINGISVALIMFVFIPCLFIKTILNQSLSIVASMVDNFMAVIAVIILWKSLRR